MKANIHIHRRAVNTNAVGILCSNNHNPHSSDFWDTRMMNAEDQTAFIEMKKEEGRCSNKDLGF